MNTHTGTPNKRNIKIVFLNFLIFFYISFISFCRSEPVSVCEECGKSKHFIIFVIVYRLRKLLF